MNKLMILLISFLFASNINSQNFSVSFSRPSQTAYLGMDNYLSCTVEGVSCKLLLFSTDNGEIKKTSCGKYIYRPLKVADTKIIIYKKVNNKIKKVGNFFVLARNLPDPVAEVSFVYDGHTAKGSLCAQDGVGARAAGFLGIDITYTVESFATIVMRNKELIFHQTNNSNMFNDETKKFFKSLQKDDVVTFSSILIKAEEGKDLYLKPLEFKID